MSVTVPLVSFAPSTGKGENPPYQDEMDNKVIGVQQHTADLASFTQV